MRRQYIAQLMRIYGDRLPYTPVHIITLTNDPKGYRGDPSRTQLRKDLGRSLSTFAQVFRDRLDDYLYTFFIEETADEHAHAHGFVSANLSTTALLDIWCSDRVGGGLVSDAVTHFDNASQIPDLEKKPGQAAAGQARSTGDIGRFASYAMKNLYASPNKEIYRPDRRFQQIRCSNGIGFKSEKQAELRKKYAEAEAAEAEAEKARAMESGDAPTPAVRSYKSEQAARSGHAEALRERVGRRVRIDSENGLLLQVADGRAHILCDGVDLAKEVDVLRVKAPGLPKPVIKQFRTSTYGRRQSSRATSERASERVPRDPSQRTKSVTFERPDGTTIKHRLDVCGLIREVYAPEDKKSLGGQNPGGQNPTAPILVDESLVEGSFAEGSFAEGSLPVTHRPARSTRSPWLATRAIVRTCTSGLPRRRNVASYRRRKEQAQGEQARGEQARARRPYGGRRGLGVAGAFLFIID